MSKIKNFFLQELPRLSQWQYLFKVLSKKEKYLFFSFFFLAIISFLFLTFDWYFKNTIFVPETGGEYKEGVIGQPRFINPLYLSTNDLDRDLVNLLFSSLLRYNSKGEIIKDLAQNFQIKENKDFYFQLKENIFWHDGEPLTVDDIIFTIELIQNPQYKSPQRIEFSGIRVKKGGRNKISFHLQKKYSAFLETIVRLKIIPKHIFQDLSPEDLPWILGTEKYLVGSGPFQLEEIKRDKTGYIKKIALKRNEKFYSSKPFLEKISFYFYEVPEVLFSALKSKKINGFAFSNPHYLKKIDKKKFQIYYLSSPRYFALFFNFNNSEILKNKEIRKALNYLIDKKEILEKVFLNQGKIVNSPILADYFGFSSPSFYKFNLEKGGKILEQQGFYLNQKGFRVKIQEKEEILFKKNLKYKDQGEEVKELQKCLAQDKKIYPKGEINGYFDLKTKEAVIRFQEKYALEILKPIGLKRGTGEVKEITRRKLNQICSKKTKEIIPLELNLTTLNKFPLAEMAEILKNQLEAAGIKIELKKVSLAELQTDILAKRNFEMFLFGQSFGQILDPFSFWHSSQKEYPGLNITSYQSKKGDILLIKIRESSTNKERRRNLEKFQKIILNDVPAIFLVQNYSFYIFSSKLKGFSLKKFVSLSDRFTEIEKWHLKTKRKWK